MSELTGLREIGEEGIIAYLCEKFSSEEGITKGIGDDCAVIEREEGYTLLTTDMLVSGDHFNREWQTPEQIGWKSMVVNVSDIAAMGGSPEWGLVSIALPEDLSFEYLKAIFKGIARASKKYQVDIIGGDTTHGNTLTINITIVGEVEEDHLCLRGDARVGDLVGVTGDLGKSWAGLELLRAGKEGYTDFYLNPECRLDVARQIAPHTNAMIDVSDGLASEVNHICDESCVGAEIERSKIPISRETEAAAERLGKDPLRWALSGGEDFELIYTVPEDELKKIDKSQRIKIGRVTEEGVFLLDGEEEVLNGGYDHFSS